MIPDVVLDAMAAAIVDEIVEIARTRSGFSARAMAERALTAALETGEVLIARCSCPVGWGQVRDANCPTHSKPEHTVSGLAREAMRDRASVVGEQLPPCPTCGAPAVAITCASPPMYEPRLGAGRRVIPGAKPGAPMIKCGKGHTYWGAR